MKPKKAARPAKPQKKGKAKPPKPKQTAEQISDKQRQETLLSHRRKMKPLINAFKNAKAAMDQGFKLAEKDGHKKKDVELAIALETQEGQEKLQSQIQNLLDIDRYTTGGKTGVQLELFGKKNSKEQAFEDGRLAALDDKRADPPEHLSQAAAQHWLEGWHDGQEQRNKTLAQGFKPLGAVAGAVAGSGSEAIDSVVEDDEEREAA